MDVVTLGAANAAANRKYGAQTVDVSAGNVTLTAVASRVRITGATTARTVTVPDTTIAGVFVNDTDYAITILRTGASVGFTIDAGTSADLRG